MAKRTTVTLEDDVAAQLDRKTRETGATINNAIRAGLAQEALSRDEEPFRVEPRSLGLSRGLSYDNIGELLEYAEGQDYR